MRVPSGFVWTCSPSTQALDDLPVLVLPALSRRGGRDDRAALFACVLPEGDLDDVPFVLLNFATIIKVFMTPTLRPARSTASAVLMRAGFAEARLHDAALCGISGVIARCRPGHPRCGSSKIREPLSPCGLTRAGAVAAPID